MSELQKLFDHAAEHVAVMFKERGEVAPMWHAVDRDNEHLVICTPWSDADEKYAIVKRLCQLFHERGVKRYVFMCEAWTLEAPNLKDIENHIGRFAEHPDRREVLTIQAEDCDGNSLMGLYYILRPEHAPATLSPLKVMKGSMRQGGTLTGLLR
jgi:hypothetical protein